MASDRHHWDAVYGRRRPDELSWYQEHPGLSLELIAAAGVAPDARILDVGGGASNLVDRLLELGYRRVGVLDISGAALEVSKRRLGSAADRVEWLVEDVLSYSPAHEWDVWHDRAVFHFLIDPEDRLRYRGALERAVAQDGNVIVAAFGPEGPSRCSGLETLRLSGERIGEELGPAFRLEEERLELHVTPSGAVQQFVYARLERVRGIRGAPACAPGPSASIP